MSTTDVRTLKAALAVVLVLFLIAQHLPAQWAEQGLEYWG